MRRRLALLTLLLLCALVYESVTAIPSGSYMVYRIEPRERIQRTMRPLHEDAMAIISEQNPKIKFLLFLHNFTSRRSTLVCYIGVGGGEIRVAVLGANSSFYTVRYTLALYNATLACMHIAQNLSLFREVEWARKGRYLVTRLDVFNVTRLHYVSARDNGVYDEGGNLLGEWLFWLPEATLKQGYTLVLAHLHPAEATLPSGAEGDGVAVLLGVNFSKAVKGPGYRVGNVVIPPTSLVQGSTVQSEAFLIHYKCKDSFSRDSLLALLFKYFYSSAPPEFKLYVVGNDIWVNHTAMTSFNRSGTERKPWRLVPYEYVVINSSELGCMRIDRDAVVELSGKMFLVSLFYYRALWDRSTGVLVELSQEPSENPFSSETPAVLSEYLGSERGDSLYAVQSIDYYFSLRLVDTNVIKPPSHLGSPGRPDTRAESVLVAAVVAGVLLYATGIVGRAVGSVLKKPSGSKKESARARG
ncbi:hypothetical protein IG193_08925 [Infirmifilum lucidum]|uniref:Uncharacterized protein n=1 Tax=Infirmifilum lucidum TaxID=2776706 RepID=A0A7L9FHM1_9CREN|nr:hypothetical protein [Infirmifilum lucidum]QOJ78852.1 hypothetical protein IG193_08925 [Infirmifilum lucidum]